MKRSEASAIIASLVACYPHARLEPAHLAAYERGILDADAGTAAAACRRIIGRSTFFPSIAEIRTEIVELSCSLPSVDKAVVQFEAGNWHKQPAEFQEAARTIAGTYRDLCDSRMDQRATMRAQFRVLYEALRRASVDARRSYPAIAAPAERRQIGGKDGR